MSFRNIVLGSHVFIPSRVDYRNAILRSQLAIITFVVAIGYFFIDVYHDVQGNDVYYLAVAVMSLITIVLNRFQRYRLATVLFLLAINFFVFYFSVIDPFGSGVFMLFAVTSLMAFALLGFRHRKLAFFFIFLSVSLFLISYWGDFNFVDERTYSKEYLQFSYTINFVVTLICSIAIIYFLMDLHHHSQKALLDKNEQLQKANTELDRFVYSASHDLRAPLSSLLGLIEVAKLDHGDVDHYLDMMRGKIHDLEDFIKEIISYSRNARMEVKKQPVNLKQIVDEVTEALTFSVGNPDIRIDNLVAENMIVYTDSMRLKIVLSNLIDNSLKYRDEQKEKPFIRIEATERDHVKLIIVKDNGVGIDQVYLEKIFQMFFRASESSKGSGLGLYIVKETLGKINGSIQVESSLGTGTTFMVRIPS
ncbi:MAG: HAMP domain-containing histidine kinase [Bacteroidota bacterium]|nr:HAMP domain-containing histidine kinase [Bacteroidota bacterium]